MSPRHMLPNQPAHLATPALRVFRFFPDRGVEARADAWARFDCSFFKIL